MKKILAVLFLTASLTGLCQAVDMDVWRSSNTATADTLQNLCVPVSYIVQGSTITYNNHGVFHGVCINTGVAGTFTVYNSSGTAANTIAAVSTATTQPCSFYDVAISSGLTYTNSATANLTILYQCY